MSRLDEKLTEIRKEQPKLSDAGLSKAVTGSKDWLRDLRRKKILPKTENLARLAQLMDVSTDWLLGQTDKPQSFQSDVRMADVRVPYRGGSANSDLPVRGTALGHLLQYGEDGIYVEQMTVDYGDAIRYIQRPPALIGVDSAYAVYIEGDSMYPRYKPGELAVVDPRKPPQIGDDVIVQLVGDHDDDGNGQVVCVMVKELVRRSASFIELRQFNPGGTFRVDAAKVVSVHRIVPIGDLLGA